MACRTGSGSNALEQCRVCLSVPTKTNWLHIFTDYDAGPDGYSLMHLLEEVTGHVVKPDEDLPERICLSCLVAAKTAFNFKQRLEKSFYLMKEHRLDNDIRFQTGEPPFECSHCLKTFSSKLSLKTHINTHTGERPYECSHCPNTFAHQSKLRVHLRTHTGEQPFECSYCLKKFSQKSNLKRHIRTHTGERPYECSKCLKTFNHRDILKYHLGTHNRKQS